MNHQFPSTAALSANLFTTASQRQPVRGSLICLNPKGATPKTQYGFVRGNIETWFEGAQ